MLDLTLKEKSLLFAELSALAYKNPKQVEAAAKKMGVESVVFYDKSGAQAYQFVDKNNVIIACRGTQPNQFNDIKADLKALKVMAETVGKVHKGFKEEVDDLWPDIKKGLKALRKQRDLYFCGHSLGAAMATIMASRCQDDKDMPEVKELYTYGSPRVGNKKFVQTLTVEHHRWVNNNDVVTRVPYEFLGYKHDGEEYYMNAYGQVRNPTGWQRIKDKFRGFWFGLKAKKIDSFTDHSIISYVNNLKDWQKES